MSTFRSPCRRHLAVCRFADLTMIGLPNPTNHPDDFSESLAARLVGIDAPTPVMFVLASDDIDLEAILA